MALSDLAAKTAPSIVSVCSPRSRSSGFLWQSGLVVTAEEPLPEEAEIAVGPVPGTMLAAELLGRDAATDIALLRVNDLSLTPIALGSSPVSTGQIAMTVGTEDGDMIAAFGIVSRTAGPWRSLRGGEIDARIELNVHLRPSAEGGLALNASGQVIGMVVSGARQRVLVIPSATVERIASRLASHGHIARGYLGLGLQPVTVEGSEGSGVIVLSIDPKGPASAAGIHQGDVLVTWNTEPIRNVRSLLRALGPDSVGQEITLGLRRGGETRQVRLTIAERSKD
jgi:S1-C subfamily serine protease